MDLAGTKFSSVPCGAMENFGGDLRLAELKVGEGVTTVLLSSRWEEVEGVVVEDGVISDGGDDGEGVWGGEEMEETLDEEDGEGTSRGEMLWGSHFPLFPELFGSVERKLKIKTQHTTFKILKSHL